MKTANPHFSFFNDKYTNLKLVESKHLEKLLIIYDNYLNDLSSLATTYKFNTDIPLLIKAIKNNNSDVNLTRIGGDNKHSKFKILQFKVKSLLTLNKRIIASKARIELYSNCIMTYNTFHALNSTVNYELSKSILRGYKFNIAIGTGVGSIVVERKTRKFLEDGTTKDKSINWVESNRFKKTLELNNIPVYNKLTNPTGRKWFIYHTAENVYYINWTCNLTQHHNFKFYTFKPTWFVNTKVRLKDEILDKVGDVEQIINNSKLGLINKLNYILTFNSNYAIRYEK